MGLSALFEGDWKIAIKYLAFLSDVEEGDRDVGRITALLNERWPDNGVQWTHGMTPTWAWGQADGQLVVFICHASTQQGLSLLGGAELGVRDVLPGIACNPALQDPAFEIRRNLTPSKRPPANILLVGHSYGGGVAEVLSALFASYYPDAKVQVLTFGSPRPGDVSMMRWCDSITTVRIMTAGDPIPYFPPQWTEAPFGVSLLGPVVAVNFSQFVQPGGGVIIYQDGSTKAAVLPDTHRTVADLDLALWATGTSAFRSTEHHYRTYQSRINQIKDPVVCPNVGPLAGLKGEISQEVDVEAFKLGPVLGPKAQRQMEALEMQSVYIPPLYRFKVGFIGNQYVVTWMGNIVLTGQTKSNAKTFAKAGNKLLRVLQSTKSVDHTAFGNSLQAYLTVASSAVSGFMPVLTVT